MSMIQIEKITKIGNRYEAIANDGKDYGSEISTTILLRAAEGWNGKTKLYFNDETNKWTRVAEFPEPKAPKASKVKTQAISKTSTTKLKRTAAAKAVKQRIFENADGSVDIKSGIGEGFGTIKYIGKRIS